jgi:tetratricopeptide (TPR) repeat protein
MLALLDGLVPGLPEMLRDQILARAEGVPLYAVETVRMLLDRGLLAADGPVYRPTGEIETLEVPETLHALIAARLDGVSPEERRLLQDSAVLGKTFTARALAALSGLQEEDLRALLTSLVRKEVLGVQADPRSPEHGQYGFLQDLVRHVAYETLSKRDRKTRHLAAAQYLRVAFPEEDEVAEVLASHYLAAFDAAPDADDAEAVRTQAREMLVRAGERSASLAAPEEAQRYFEQAAALSEDGGAKAELTDRAGEMAWVADKPAEARALLNRARADYEEQGNPAGAARVDARLAEIDFVEGHPPQAVARLQPALSALESAGSSEADIAELAHQLGRFMVFTGDYDGAAPHLERALGIAEAANLPETLAEALNTKAVLMMRWHRPEEARILIEGALAIALAHDLNRAALRAYNNLAVSLIAVDRWRDETELERRALELARRVGDRQWESTFLARSVSTLIMRGEWDDALERAAVAEELAATEFAQGMALKAATVHGHRGDVERARELLSRHADIADSENPDFAAVWVSLDAAVLGMEGRPEEAIAAVSRLLRIHDSVGGPPPWIFFWALEGAAVAGDDEIRELLGRFEELGPNQLIPSMRAMQARLRARLPEFDAERELSQAAQLFEELEMPFHLAVVRLEHAELLTARDRANEAEPLLAAARETFERLKATPWLERTARLALLGERHSVAAQ